MWILFSLLLIEIVVLVLIIRRRKKRPERIGEAGEQYISQVLACLSQDYTTYNNVVLKTERGTTQIDHIVVSKHGIFVIETKNYRGDIYGNDDERQWKQIIVTPVNFARKPWKTYTYVKKSYFYNPVKQSYAHVYALKNVLKDYPHLPIIPIVVFIGDARLKRINSKNHVVNVSSLLDTITYYQSIFLSDGGQEDVKALIIASDKSNEISKREHVRNLRREHKINY